MHYVMDDLEVDFLLDAVDFVAEHGHGFLRLYDFDLFDGSWSKKANPARLKRFSLEAALEASVERTPPMSLQDRQKRYTGYLEAALKIARKLAKKDPSVAHELSGALAELQFFSLPECCMESSGKKPRKSVIRKLKSIFSSNK